MMASVHPQRMLPVVMSICVVLMAVSCVSPSKTEPPAATQLAVDVRFTAMWWSEAQMEGLDPNNPPPKSTEVELARWEYTDPVGVPHPDEMDILVSVANKGATPLSDLIVTTEGEWRVGSLGDEPGAKWGESSVLRRSDGIQVQGGSTQTIRVPVSLKQMMDALEPQNRWPYGLRVNVRVEQLGGSSHLAGMQVEFPIRPGN
jgi:hypothetical protein